MASPLSPPRFGRLLGLQGKLLRRYDHQPLVACLSGLYGCRWRRWERSRTRPGDCCCDKLEGASLVLLVAAFCLTLVFLFFWGQAENDYNDFDWFNFGNLGFWFPWSVVLLVIAAGFFTYVTVLVLLAVCLLSESQKLYLHWSHKVPSPSPSRRHSSSLADVPSQRSKGRWCSSQLKRRRIISHNGIRLPLKTFLMTSPSCHLHPFSYIVFAECYSHLYIVVKQI